MRDPFGLSVHPQTEQFHTTPIADVVEAVDGRILTIEQLSARYDDSPRLGFS